MKNIIIAGLLLFLVYIFLDKKKLSGAITNQPAGGNLGLSGNRSGNEQGGANAVTAIVSGATDVINNLIDHAFSRSAENDPPQSTPSTL